MRQELGDVCLHAIRDGMPVWGRVAGCAIPRLIKTPVKIIPSEFGQGLLLRVPVAYISVGSWPSVLLIQIKCN
jgi:hypothetical protein